MSRQIAFAIDPCSDEAKRTIEWSKQNFLRSEDEIHAIMVLVMDSEFLDDQGKVHSWHCRPSLTFENRRSNRTTTNRFIQGNRKRNDSRKSECDE